jgi:predicted nuclease with RNAse H fold
MAAERTLGPVTRTQPTVTSLGGPVALGIDVGADRLHVVGLCDDGTIALTQVIDPRDPDRIDAVLAAAPPGSAVAIDGPGGPSAAAHALDRSLSTKFRTARGCEIALGRRRGIWVSFTTPTAVADMAPWMQVSIDVHRRSVDAGHQALETFPYAVFHTLAGGRPPKKTTAAGLSARVGLLGRAGIEHPTMAMWSHDAIDATACALVALQRRRGDAEVLRDDLDGTEIWLPTLG